MNQQTSKQLTMNMPPMKWMALTSCVALLCACGGGSGTSGDDEGDRAQVSNAISGTISGLGSVVVNGVRYETIGASVLDVDDSSTIQTALGLGMPVNLMPLTSSSTTAGVVYVQTGLKGRSSALRLSGEGSNLNGTVLVAGLPVTFDVNTFVLQQSGAMGSLSDLANSQNLEVYGVPQSSGQFKATRIEIEATAQTVRLVGAVSGLDTSNRTFTLGDAVNAVTIRYTGDPQGLANGAVVSVRTTTYDSASRYTASSVRVRSTSVSLFNQYLDNYRGTSSASTEKHELYGMVSALQRNDTGSCSMQVQGVPTTVASPTLCAAIQEGDYVEVKGLFANGSLTAYRVEFKTAGNDRDLAGYSDDANDDDGDRLKYRRLSSSGSSSASYELYGTLSNCDSGSCTLNSNGTNWIADISTAIWKYGAVSSGLVEAKGYMTTANTFKVIKIESKNGSSSASDGRSGGYMEMYGTLSNCNASTCSLSSNGSVWTVDVSTANWEHGRVGSGWVEVKGTITATNALKAYKIETKS